MLQPEYTFGHKGQNIVHLSCIEAQKWANSSTLYET